MDSNKTLEQPLIPRLPRDFVINLEQAANLRRIIVNVIEVENVLELVNKKLKEIYLKRCNEEDAKINQQKPFESNLWKCKNII